jgi:peptidyl-prolyl cis-trans isomerase B (cyclophilin B)
VHGVLPASASVPRMTKTTMQTNHGTIELELFDEDAPKTVENFTKLARDGFYDGVIFHRVIPDFMIQGGDPTGTGTGGPGYSVPAEFNDTKHERGIVSMARGDDPNSASTSFFICLAPAPSLDGKYTVFGRVVSGMDVLQAIEKTPVDGETPVMPIQLTRVRVEEVK